MSDSEPMVSALIENVAKARESADHDRMAEEIISLSIIALLLRQRIASTEAIIDHIRQVHSTMSASYHSEAVDQRLAAVLERIEALGADELPAVTIEGEISPD
jgi:hypothetical protein